MVVGVRRGVFCPQNHDSWRKVTRGGRPSFHCVPCNRQQARDSARRRREDPLRQLFEMARNRAATKRWEFTITLQDVQNAWPANGLCPVFGLVLTKQRGFASDTSASLDRLDPNKGYTPDNILVMSLRANRAKGNMTTDEIGKLYRWMSAQERTP